MTNQHSAQECKTHAEWLLGTENKYGLSADEELLCNMVLGLVEQLEALRKVARDLYDDGGVDDIDQRLNYVVVQITREVWNDFAAHLEGSIPASEPKS